MEAVIALSIVLLAREALDDRETWTKRWPWLVAFAFGLIHGFGFAGALVELGLPPDHALPALLAFNGGVELGQVAFVALAWLPARSLAAGRLRPLLPYAMGILATAWTLERVLGYWPA